MADINLTQAEADALIAMEKHRANEDLADFPWKGGSLIISLQSPDKREQFLLDISRSRIDFSRANSRTGLDRSSSWCGWTSAAPPTATRTVRKWPALIFIYIVRVMATSGLPQSRWSFSKKFQISSARLRTL